MNDLDQVWGAESQDHRMQNYRSRVSLSSEYGTYKTVKAKFWLWLSGKKHTVPPMSSELSQSVPDSGLDFSHHQYDSVQNNSN